MKGLRASAPGEVEGALGRLGPDAMLADSSPAMLARVSGAASNSPAARNIVDAALKAREAGTATRLEADTTRNFGQMVPARMATADVSSDDRRRTRKITGPRLMERPGL